MEDLLHFVTESYERLRVLTLDCSAYLPQLRALLPEAELFAVTEHPDVPQRYAACGAEFSVLPWHREELPFDANFFDLVLAEGCLERSPDPYLVTQELAQHIKPTGHLLTQFPNIRYRRVLEGLRQGVFRVRERHLFAKGEVVRLLNDANFKEITFAPAERDILPTEAQEWEAFGFDNFSCDLTTAAWLVKASRSTAQVAALKSLYDEDTRLTLAKLLRRIEYGLDPEENLARLWQHCRDKLIFPLYLSDFIRETSYHEGRLRLRLVASAREQGLEDFAGALG